MWKVNGYANQVKEVNAEPKSIPGYVSRDKYFATELEAFEFLMYRSIDDLDAANDAAEKARVRHNRFVKKFGPRLRELRKAQGEVKHGD